MIELNNLNGLQGILNNVVEDVKKNGFDYQMDKDFKVSYYVDYNESFQNLIKESFDKGKYTLKDVNNYIIENSLFNLVSYYECETFNEVYDGMYKRFMNQLQKSNLYATTTLGDLDVVKEDLWDYLEAHIEFNYDSIFQSIKDTYEWLIKDLPEYALNNEDAFNQLFENYYNSNNYDISFSDFPSKMVDEGNSLPILLDLLKDENLEEDEQQIVDEAIATDDVDDLIELCETLSLVETFNDVYVYIFD